MPVGRSGWGNPPFLQHAINLLFELVQLRLGHPITMVAGRLLSIINEINPMLYTSCWGLTWFFKYICKLRQQMFKCCLVRCTPCHVHSEHTACCCRIKTNTPGGYRINPTKATSASVPCCAARKNSLADIGYIWWGRVVRYNLTSEHCVLVVHCALLVGM